MIKALPRRLPAYAQWSKFLQTTLKESTDRDAVMLCNVALIRKQAARWSSLLPSVEPHYGTCAHCRAYFSNLLVHFSRFLARPAWFRLAFSRGASLTQPTAVVDLMTRRSSNFQMLPRASPAALFLGPIGFSFHFLAQPGCGGPPVRAKI